MKRIVFALLLMFSIVSLAQEGTAIVIDWSPEMTQVSGTVQVRGTVNPVGLRNYFLEVAAYDPDSDARPQWIPVSLPSRTPVVDGTLAEWNTTVLPDGVYQLRLHVVLETQDNSEFYTLAPIAVANAGPATVEGSVQVIQTPAEFAAAAVEPTPEPTPEIAPPPEVINELPVPVGGHVLHFNEAAQEALQTAGMTWVKWQLPYTLGAEQAFLDVARDRINRTHEAGFKVLLSVIGDVAQLRELEEEYYPAFANVLGRLADLRPDAIEVWNEMNIDREWPTGRIDPRAYAEMLRPVYEAIKATNPDVMVITGALAPTGAEGVFGSARVWNDDRYYQGMANAGIAEIADCIGLHYNEGIVAPRQRGGDPRVPDYPTRYFLPMLERASLPFRRAGSDIPLCLTEMGYLSPEGYGRLPANFAWAVNTSVEEQAEWLRDAIVLAADFDEREVALIIIWNIDFESYEDDPQAGYAIIRADGSCPACQTIGSLREPR